MKYTIIYDENDVICLDREEGRIKTLKYGHFEDITKQCERMRKSKTKSDCMGAHWHKMLTNDETNYRWSETLHTDSDEEYFNFLIDRQVKQARAFLHVVEKRNNWREPYAIGYSN